MEVADTKKFVKLFEAIAIVIYPCDFHRKISGKLKIFLRSDIPSESLLLFWSDFQTFVNRLTKTTAWSSLLQRSLGITCRNLSLILITYSPSKSWIDHINLWSMVKEFITSNYHYRIHLSSIPGQRKIWNVETKQIVTNS